jgi:hypothetical protein
MTRTLAGLAAALMGTIAVVGAQAPARAPAPKQAASPTKLERTYTGCVRRMLGEINFRLVDAVEVKAASASSKPTALRLIMPKGKESNLFDYISHKVEVTGILGDPLPVNNAMDDVKHLAITNIKNISDSCR